MPLDIFDRGLPSKTSEAPMYQAPLDEEPSTGTPLEENQEYDEDGLKLPEEEDNLDETSIGLGTNTLIGALKKLPSQSRDNIFDCIIVNVSTIVRNSTTKERDPAEIEQRTEDDTYRLMLAIADYHSTMGSLVKNPTAIFFLPDYSWLPALHCRPDTGNRKIIREVTESLIKKDNLKVRKRIRSITQSTNVFEIYAGGRNELPYQTVIKEIYELYKVFGRFDPRSSLTHYLLISHNPLDYHFMLKFPKTTMLESFTMQFIKPKMLGYKVFGTNFIPYNSVTHLLFGDKVLVKPMAQRKNRALLTDLAKKQSWYVLTPSEIEQRVAWSGQVPKGVLTHLKL